MFIDLNCDMGEGYGPYRICPDERVMPLITSANVACGFHASEPGTMRRTVRLAKQHGVAVGAHPGFPDRVGFGRRFLAATPEEVRDDVTYQIGALWAFCRAEGVQLRHVKAHGALYNAAATDPALATAICDAVRAVDPELYVVCLANSPFVEVARMLGVRFVQEAFADRAYTRGGTLVPRSNPGSLIHDPERAVDRVVRMVRERKVESIDGQDVPVDARTLCVHGDTPGALDLIVAIRARLGKEGIAIRPFSED
jgi:UPF0271 protein